MKTCKSCFHCRCKLSLKPPLPYKKIPPGQEIFYTRISYGAVEISCSKNQWFYRNKPYIYVGRLDRFNHAISYANNTCKHYEN